jgi:hypothetical protein
LGKGARNRAKSSAEKAEAQKVLTQLGVRRMIDKDVRKSLAEATDRFFDQEIAVILWVLHEVFGFGKLRLRRFYNRYDKEARRLRAYYEMDDKDIGYLARRSLKGIGVDLDQWKREGINDE